jgi:hypothetical protein
MTRWVKNLSHWEVEDDEKSEHTGGFYDDECLRPKRRYGSATLWIPSLLFQSWGDYPVQQVENYARELVDSSDDWQLLGLTGENIEPVETGFVMGEDGSCVESDDRAILMFVLPVVRVT